MKILYQYRWLVIFSFFAASCLGGSGFAQETAKDKIDFNRDVKPILSDRCFLCHGPDAETREADLRLDTEEGAAVAIEVGSSDDSDLYHRIMSEDDPMPPEDSNLSLTTKEKQILKRWIDEGAVWAKHWSFVKPEKRTPPETEQADWIRNPIDQFVLAQLVASGLKPAQPATKEKLLRRLSFDLTGLPPTLSELDQFLSDESDSAYESAVDRLLASPRYGERMTADWLDVARYSDTYGYQVDRNRFVWPWRDWVIRSFNENLSYDQFVTQQLAGDLLPNPTRDQILATTFNRLHPQKVEGGSVNEEFRVEYVADRMQTAGMAFMGLTVECARCHDHKYDPISQKEYYELFSFFNNIDESGLYSYFDAEAIPSPSMLLPNEKQERQLVQFRKNVAAQEALVDEDLKRATHDFEKWFVDFDTRKQKPEKPPGLLMNADLVANKGANTVVDGPAGTKGLKLTGDDEVKLAVGDFGRHQPFTIAARINVPDDEKILERCVIYHRSRAWTDSASRGYQLLIKNGKLSASLIHFWPGNAISVETKEPIPTEQWLHVSFRYDGSSTAEGIEILIDGKPVDVIIVKNNLEKKIKGNGTSHLTLGARFRDIGFKNGQIADLTVFDRKLSDIEVAELHQLGVLDKLLAQPADVISNTQQDVLFEFYLAARDEKHQTVLQELADKRQQLNQTIDAIEEIMVMKELPDARAAFILARGAYDAPSTPVAAATPAVFPKMPDSESANRLGFARWLTSPDHPLTSRVAVNHYWQVLFGEGLVRTPEDFGSQGQQPTHPELLDWLAVDFQENDWDIKRLLKLIVMSNTYRQSTAASEELLKLDPDNELLARAPTFRLPAEMIRDNVLATSGLLVEKIGGAPVRPYELEKSFKPSKPDKGEGLYRRSLYTFWQRNGPAPAMLTLDAAKRDVCQVKRERTSSPLAVLVQLNNPQTVEASRKLAEKLTGDNGADKNAIGSDLFRLLTSRKPSEREQKIVVELFDAQYEYFKNNTDATNAFLAVGDSKIESSEPAVIAAWAAVANTLFSFDECVMRR